MAVKLSETFAPMQVTCLDSTADNCCPAGARLSARIHQRPVDERWIDTNSIDTYVDRSKHLMRVFMEDELDRWNVQSLICDRFEYRVVSIGAYSIISLRPLAPSIEFVAMATGKMALPLVAMAVAMVVMSSMGGALAAAAVPCFPLDCASYVLEGRAVPLKFCCIEVQDQFLLKTGVGIGGYCNAVTAVQRFDGPLVGAELDLALNVPNKCGLSSYYAKGFRCAGKIIPGGV